MDRLYMDIARRLAKESYARRKKVGFCVVKDDNILSIGWNGTPAGDDNNCEEENADGTLTTKHTVLHAELNALMKLVARGGQGVEGATGYATLSPCAECGKLIKQAKLARIVYDEEYRDASGIEFLRTRGIQVEQIQ
jgi:dCMP deaminase